MISINKTKNILIRVLGIKSLSIYQLTLILLVFSATLSVVFVSGIWAYTESIQAKNSIRELKDLTIIKQKEKLKEGVQRVINYIEYRKNDTLFKSTLEIQNEVLNYFKDVRFGSDGYIFINTYDGNALLFDGQKLEPPKNISDLTDPNGLQIFKKELELTKLPEGGYFQYLFKKIYDSKPEPKISYVKGYNEWEWIIGTGDYFDNIEAEVLVLESNLKRELYKNILIVVGVFTAVLILLIGFAFLAAKSIQNQFDKLLAYLKSAVSPKQEASVASGIFIRELKTIAQDIMHAENKAKISNQRFVDLFNNAPIALWDEDFTALLNYLDAQLLFYNVPVGELLEKHPEILYRCSELANVINVNNKTLELYEAQSKEELLGNLNKIFTEESFDIFKQSLLALKSGKKFFSNEGKNLSIKGKKLDLLLSWSFLSDEKNASNEVIVSVIDLTDLRKTEEELTKHRQHLEELVEERTKELEAKNTDLERINKAFVGRELRMVELKKEIEKLKGS